MLPQPEIPFLSALPTCTTSLADHDAVVLENRCVGSNFYVMQLATPNTLAFVPGQFVMIDLPQSGFFLRRPMSIMQVIDAPEPYRQAFSIFYKVHGKGTQAMSTWPIGQATRVLGPLGKGFPLPVSGQSQLMVGGGIGVAPFVAVQAHARAQGIPLGQNRLVYGVRSSQDIGILPELEALFGSENLLVCTQDGSQGIAGTVIDALTQRSEWLADAHAVLTCGPTPMMRALAGFLDKQAPALPLWVSLEERMPCGTGACTGCVITLNTSPLPVKTCIEGPVFLANTIDWEASAPKTLAVGGGCK